MAAPGSIHSGLVKHFLMPSFARNGSSKNFIVYSCVPEELYVVLLYRFPRARMETACLVKKMDMKNTLECEAQR